MCDEFKTVIGVIAGAVIGGAVSFLSGFFMYLIQRKGDAEEKFFYDVYQRRIALYEDVIKELYAMQALELNKVFKISNIEMSEIIIEKLQTLDALITRLILFGSANSKEAIGKLRNPMFVLQQKALIDPQGNGCEIATSLYGIIEITIKAFTNVISQDVSSLADEKIVKYLKKIGHKKPS